MNLIDKILKERYKITEKIESGGMAVVYKGTDLLLVRTVAIKVLKDSFTRDKGVLERFYREARAAAGLSHTNIVSIYDIGREDDLYFIVMEYMSNGTLENVMERKKELSTEEVIKYGIQICRALDYSHQKRVIHRDIKPQNIMLTEENQIKVVDFGIARAVDLRDITQSGVIMGSAYYFSPEQASGKTATERSDIYSLGVLLYHMSSGRLPFDGNSLMELAGKHIKENPKSLRSINPSIPADLEKVILKSMEKKPENRYASAQDFLSDLQACAASIDGLELENINDRPYSETVSPESDGGDSTFFSEDYEKQLQSDTDTSDEEEIIFTLDDLKQRKKTTKTIPFYYFILFSLIIIFITGITMGIIWAIKRPVPVETLVSVPDIKGRKENQARASLEQWGLVLGDVKTEYNYDIMSGAIISQKPEAGTTVKKGTVISVVVSSGSRKVIIPYVVQMNLSDAQLKVSQKGLTLTVVSEEYHEDLKPNYIISQEPPAGTEVDGKTVVKVVISKAREGISVPNLKGLSKKAAEELLALQGLKLLVLREEAHKKIKKGKIISQEPPVDTLVEGNYTVKVILSSGPVVNSPENNKIIVPELLARTLKDAKNTAEQLGLTLVTRSDEGNINDDMIVSSQSPVAGTKITKDKKIQVSVKSKVIIVEVPDVRGKLLMDAKNALRLKGLSAGNISEMLSNDLVPGTVLQQEPLPKTLLPTGSSVGLVVSKTQDKSLVIVPSLVGMNVNEAKLLLEKKELLTGSVIIQPSEEQTGIVLSQQPAGGMSVKKGTEINLIVSK
ncbi:MAG: Stk1 family PASTA domain-containing Ser/Thr kinase [Candidatus Eremiobacterota bacterium]